VAIEAAEHATPASAGLRSGEPLDRAAPPIATRRSQARVTGIDMARALALIGMLAVHVGPEDGPGVMGRLYSLAFGRASILFILVAGIGITLLSSRAMSSGAARMRLACFSLVLLPLGLSLQLVGHPIAVILHHYAAFYLVGMLVLGLPSRTLFALAAATTLVGPVLYFLAGTFEDSVFDRTPVTLLDDPLNIAQALIVSGPYPLLVWSAPLLWGMWLGRQDLRTGRTQMLLCLIGAAIAILAVIVSTALLALLGDPHSPRDPLMLLAHVPHSQMPLWLISSTGSAMFVLGASLLFAARFPRIAEPFVLLGQMALTMYFAHVLVLAALRHEMNQDAVISSLATVVVMTAVAMLFAFVWRKLYARGPLEMLMHLLPSLMDRTLSANVAPLPEGKQRRQNETEGGRLNERERTV
jgi:uncharacterized membrane protein